MRVGDSVGCEQQNIGADYTEEELVFLKAMEKWKKVNRCHFPKFTDVLAVVISLGYHKDGTEQLPTIPQLQPPLPSKKRPRLNIVLKRRCEKIETTH